VYNAAKSNNNQTTNKHQNDDEINTAKLTAEIDWRRP
jgi:hypothetical protein